jgi:hypothetical protein
MSLTTAVLAFMAAIAPKKVDDACELRKQNDDLKRDLAKARDEIARLNMVVQEVNASYLRARYGDPPVMRPVHVSDAAEAMRRLGEAHAMPTVFCTCVPARHDALIGAYSASRPGHFGE